MAHLPINKVERASLDLQMNSILLNAASAGGDTFNSHEGVFVRAVNDSGGNITITIAAVDTLIPTSDAGARSVNDMTVVVPTATSNGIYFEVPPAFIGLGGIVTMTYSTEVGLFLTVMEVNHD